MDRYFNRNNLINDNFNEIGTMSDKKLDETTKRIKHTILSELEQGIIVLILGSICCWAICILAYALNI